MTTFDWRYDANTVTLVGSFTNWEENPIELKKTDFNGYFQTTIDLEPGTYEYKFIIDGRRWCYDILKPTKADQKGNRNNIVTVARGSGAPKKEVREPRKEAPKKEEVVQPESAPESAPEEPQPEPKKQERQQKGGQQQQQRKGQPQEKQQKGGKDQKKIQAAVQKSIIAVKSYNAPWYCADLDFDDDSVTLENVLEAVQVFSLEIPETACLFFASSLKCLIMAAIVPFSKTKDFPAIEMINLALSIVPGQPKGEGNDNLAHCIVMANPDASIFPIKLKDQARGSIFPVLRKRGLIKEEEDDDDDIPMSFDDV